MKRKTIPVDSLYHPEPNNASNTWKNSSKPTHFVIPNDGL